MAMIVRQLLSNRYNPCRCSCRGVIDHLTLLPCNLIRTQTLRSTRSSPFSPPTPSTDISTFEPTFQHHRELFSTGVVRSLRDCILELSRRHNGMHSIKSILRGLFKQVISCRKDGKDYSIDISVDSIVYNNKAFELICTDTSNYDIPKDFSMLEAMIFWISRGIKLEDYEYQEFQQMFSFQTYSIEFLHILLYSPALSFSKMRNRYRQWTYSKFTGSGPIDNDGRHFACISHMQNLLNKVLIAQGVNRTLNWKNGLQLAIGQDKYNDWTSMVIKFCNFKEDSAWDFLRFSRILVVHTRDELSLTDVELDVALSRAYPGFLHVLFEVVFQVKQYPVEFTSTWSFEDFAISMDCNEFELAPSCPPFRMVRRMKTPKEEIKRLTKALRT